MQIVKDKKVLKDWVCELPWKMQSVLLSGLRGPDTAHSPGIKKITRWIRNVIQNDADPSQSYMNVSVSELPSPETLEKEIEFATVHFVAHLLYALQIVGYKHPDRNIRDAAFSLYKGILVGEVLHFGIESEAEMDSRLFDLT